MLQTKTTRPISFFMLIGIIGFLAVFIGFGKTLPPAIKDSSTPVILYIHGAFAFAWLCLFFTQASLIRYDNFRLHKILGILGIVIAIGTSVTILPAGLYQVRIDLKSGTGEASYSSMIGVTTSAIMYLAMVIAALIYRSKPQVHKRLMLLATILLLWVAWFRFRHYFPSIPRGDIWFGLVLPNTLIVASWIWDKRVNGKVHPVLAWVGSFIIAEQTFETFMFDTAIWPPIGKQIYVLLTT